ncbi:MAG: SRPBCC family protein [Bacteroidetes bacterium]|nr:SRPBCC family protein [Bacteroidota bacterium]
MKILKIIGIILALYLAYAIIMGLVRKGPYEITESKSIKGDAGVIWQNISRHHEFVKWNPWSKMDPDNKVTYKGEDGAVGSSYAWVGEKMGQGEMITTSLEPGKSHSCDLNFIKPFESKTFTTMLMEPEADGTYKVSWVFKAESDFMEAAMTSAMFMDMKKELSNSFKEGLANLEKKVVEETAALPPPAPPAAIADSVATI